jgi:hypothetical protein
VAKAREWKWIRNMSSKEARAIVEKDYEFVKQQLGPCGVNCGKCFAFSEGNIYDLSKQLKEALGNFDIYAKRFVELLEEPVFLKYPEFKEFLDYLAEQKCKGCRNERCKLSKTCQVRSCSEKKNVDYCFQCEEFPCANTGFDEHLYKRYVEINMRMKKIGVEAYYEETKNLPRYR